MAFRLRERRAANPDIRRLREVGVTVPGMRRLRDVPGMRRLREVGVTVPGMRRLRDVPGMRRLRDVPTKKESRCAELRMIKLRLARSHYDGRRCSRCVWRVLTTMADDDWPEALKLTQRDLG